MTKSKKRPTIQNKHTEIELQDQVDTPIDSSTTLTSLKPSAEDKTPVPSANIACPGQSTIQEIIPVVITEEPSSKPIQKKTPAKKSTSSKKGKNGKLSTGLLTILSTTDERTTMQIANIILHLKCSMSDVQSYNEEIHKQMMNPLIYNPSVPPDIMTYHQPKNYSELNNVVTIPTPDQEDFAYKESKDSRKNRNVDHFLQNKHEEIEMTYRSTTEDSNLDFIKENGDVETKENQEEVTWLTYNVKSNERETYGCGNTYSEGRRRNPEEYGCGNAYSEGRRRNPEEYDEDQKDPCMKDIHTKLKKLKISLFKNLAFMDKKSACFWCTYDFDNPECYIPRYEMDGAIHGYGSFCRPECAAAYLMKENLDDSTKFERYHLLNHIYSKIYDYKKNIKPAPNPYYMLDKFYGNLSIQEYRKLLKSDHLLLTIDKPLTRILPELHEDNEEFLTNIYGVQSNTNIGNGSTITKHGNFKVRRQSDKPTGPTKSNIIKEHFGIK